MDQKRKRPLPFCRADSISTTHMRVHLYPFADVDLDGCVFLFSSIVCISSADS